MSARDANSKSSGLPPNWRMAALRELTTKIGSGATPRGGESAYLRSRATFALIRSQNVFDHKFQREGLAFISDSQAGELANAEVRPGDVLLNITGDGATFARACLVPDDILPARVNQHVSILRANPSFLDSGYLAAYLAHPFTKSYIESFNAGGSRRAITKGHIESFQIPLPPLDEQRQIGTILGTIDTKIELSRRMNETLEDIALTVFRRDFFNRASGTTSVLKVGEVVKIIKGRSYKSEELVEGFDAALVTLKSFERGGGYKPDGLKGFSGSFRSEQQVLPGEVVVALTDVTQNAEVIGRPALVRRSARYSKLIASLDVAIIRPQRFVGKYFLYCLFRTPEFASHTYAHCSGTTVLHLGKDAIPSFEFAMPQGIDVSKFEQAVTPIFQHVDHNDLENSTLTSLRDAILPKLVSGEIRLKDAEKIIEANA